jgi:hypothetical protein
MSDRQAIARLNDDFCHELDRGTVAGWVALFTLDALYTFGPRVVRGTEQLREFYLGRTRDGPRTSRHMVTGLRVDFTSSTQARGLSVCMAFAASGLPPIQSTVPAVVADFEDVYALVDGRWLFAERLIRPLFRAVTPP